MYNALQPLMSQLDTKPPRSQILTQLGTIELALQTEHPKMLYSDILACAYERLARDFNGELERPPETFVTYELLGVSQSYEGGMRDIRSIDQGLAVVSRL